MSTTAAANVTRPNSPTTDTTSIVTGQGRKLRRRKGRVEPIYYLFLLPTLVIFTRIEGMIEYYENGQIYQGPSVLVPKTIPVMNYAQAMVLGASTTSMLRTMDADWARIAFRAPIPKTDDAAAGETEESAP